MTDKHDKLVEMATDAGAAHVKPSDCAELFEFERRDLAAFRSAILADAAKDVKPVAWRFRWSPQGDWHITSHEPRGGDGTNKEPLYPATTVASLTAQRDAALARVAELEKDAARGRLLLKWLWSGHIPGPAWGRPIKLVETCPQFGDETEVKNIEALLDAALTKGQP